MSRTRAAAAVVVTVAFGLLATGCGPSPRSDGDRLRRLLRSAARDARSFVYEERTPSQVFVVKGTVEDDLRYKAALTIDDAVAFEEVVADDALADRILDDRAVPVLSRAADVAVPGTTADGSPPVGAPSTPLPPELLSHQWVLDRYGAPSLLPQAGDRRLLGEDPLYDALTVFRHVETAMGQALVVRKFNPDSLDYKPKEDPFPKPDRDAGIVRYDILPPRLPRPSDSAAGGALRRSLPDTPNFRKVAVYIRRERIVKILEEVDLRPRLRELERDYDLGISPEDSAEEKAATAASALNQVRRRQGSEAIRVRVASIEFIDVGADLHVELPADSVNGDLSVLLHRGVRK